MIGWWYRLTDLLPWSWAHYAFMKNALLAVLCVSPVFGMLGTMVVNNRMAFFTDVLGHSALAGIAIGALCGVFDPTVPLFVTAIVISVAVTALKRYTRASADTVLGVLMALMVSLGIVLLSRQGGFAKYTVYLIGDILAVTPAQIGVLAVVAVVAWWFWLAQGNALLLTSVSPALARSRGIRTFVVETAFTVLLAIAVMLSIRLVGILIINAMLVLPAAASRNVSRSMRSYTLWSVAISLVSGITGLILSYAWDAAAGASIVLCAVFCYVCSLFAGSRRRSALDKKRKRA